MAVDNGKDGAVYIGANKVAEISAWNFNPDAGVEDITAFGDEARRRQYTVKDVSGDFSGNGDKSDTNGQNALIEQFLSGGTPASVFLYLYVSGAQGYYGNALVHPSKGAEAAGLQSFSCSFEGSGEWLHNIA